MMKKTSLTLLLLAGCAGAAALAQQPPAPAAAPAAPAFGGRGPNPQAVMFQSRCAGCHGADLNGGRAPSLFAKAFLDGHTDADMHRTVMEGIAAADMPSFKGVLSDDEVDQLLVYIRLQGGSLAERPAFVPDPNGQVLKTKKQTVRIEVVATGLDTPWGEAFLPDGRLLVTERPGRIRIIDKAGKLLPDAVKGTPLPWVRQDGGYFDIAVHPDYARNGWIYLSYSEIVPGYSGPMPEAGVAGVRPGQPPLPPSNTRIVRGRINARGEWVDQQDIAKFPNALYTSSIIHYGSRFLFDGKGHLFFTMGERGDMKNAQDLSTPLGKVHRINDDGTIPKDNPFVNTPNAWPSIWTYGNRNPEGLAFDPRTGLLWESEHGPTGGDEINILEPGKNYGWGVVSMGSQPGITHQHEPGMVDPVVYYTPTAGPSGITFYTGSKYPGWKNSSLFVASLTGQKLLRLEVDGRKVTEQEAIYEQYGRTRQIITGPDGLFYILLQNPTGRGTSIPVFGAAPGMVIRLVPAESR